METVKNGDYKLTRRRGTVLWRREEITNLLIGAACIVKARKISQKKKELEEKGEVTAGYRQMEQNLSRVGAELIRKNLRELTGGEEF